MKYLILIFLILNLIVSKANSEIVQDIKINNNVRVTKKL